MHHEKIAGPSDVIEDHSDPGKDPSTIATTEAPTTVSTFVQREQNAIDTL